MTRLAEGNEECQNSKCEFYDETAWQRCGGDKGGEPAIASCKDWRGAVLKNLFIVVRPGKCPRIGFPIGETDASLREWMKANEGCEVLVLTSTHGGFPSPGTAWVQTAEEYLASPPESGSFYCPECGSHDVSEIAYEDDFGSMECNDCGYQGSPGEDFPADIFNEPQPAA